MKTLLLLPDGVGVRNFLCTEFVPLATEQGDLVIWHSLPPAIIGEHRYRLGAHVTWHELEVRREPLLARLLRSGKYFSQLERFPEPGAEPLLVDRSQGVIGRWVHRGGRALGKALAFAPAALPAVERLHGRAALGLRQSNPWRAFLGDERPDVLFCTHQRSSLAVPAVAAARRLGIPTATFVYSWDNLPKGRMAVWPDHYLVWSEKMASDLRHYYPETTADQVHVVGSPQFEPYYDNSLVRERADFCGSVGLDPARPIVLFTGDDATTSPHDPGYLADLARALREDDWASAAPQLLFRRSPADLSDRYRRVLAEYPEIAVSEPAWQSIGEQRWDRVVPTHLDQGLLLNLARHCAVVVNLGSTMALDFALAGKPAIYVAYEQPDTDGRHEWRAVDNYRLPHFASVHHTQPVLWARSPADLGALVRRALADPSELASNRERWIDIELARPVNEAARRCVAALDLIASSGVS